MKKIISTVLLGLLLVATVFMDTASLGVADSQSEQTKYLLRAETLIDSYGAEGYYQSEKTGTNPSAGDGYVVKYAPTSNCLVSPAKTGALSITFTAPSTATLKPSIYSGQSIAIYRTNPVLPEHNDDGVRFCVFLNDQKIYPTGDDLFAEVTSCDGSNPMWVNIGTLDLNQGDKLRYIIDNGGAGNNSWDSVYINGEGMYSDTQVTTDTYVSITQGLTYANTADAETSAGLADYKKSDLIKYEYVEILTGKDMPTLQENGSPVAVLKDNLKWSSINDTDFWCGSATDVYLYYDHSSNGEFMTPGMYSAIGLEFTAPCDGTIKNDFGLGSAIRAGEYIEGTAEKARLTIIKNEQVIFPSVGVWQDLPEENKSEEPIKIAFNDLTVNAGDKLYYVVDSGGNLNNSNDNVRFDNWGFLWADALNPDGVWFSFGENFYDGSNGDTPSAINGYKKNQVLNYIYLSVEDPIPAATDIEKKEVEAYKKDRFVQMRLNDEETGFTISGDTRHLIANPTFVQPSEKHMLAIKWTAPQSGRLSLSNVTLLNGNYDAPEAQGTDRDGVGFKILLNNKYQIYPTTGEWAETKGTDIATIDLGAFTITEGDTLLLVLDTKDNGEFDTINLRLIYDFALDGKNFTTRYDMSKMMLEENSPFEFYGIKEEKEETSRYFGGEQTELAEITMHEGGFFSNVWVIVIGVAAIVVVAVVAVFVVIIVRRRKG